MISKPEDLLFQAHQVLGRVVEATVSPKTGWEPLQFGVQAKPCPRGVAVSETSVIRAFSALAPCMRLHLGGFALWKNAN